VTETNIYTKAYEDFITSLDMKMRDAVTKLMIHTKTRPDEPQMVGVCLTAVATKNSSEAQARILEAQQTTLETLDKLKKDPELARGLRGGSGCLDSPPGFVRWIPAVCLCR
jgi:hypothetical protein